MWGITSVLWGITSVLWRVFSTVEGYLQYCGGTTSVHVGDSFSNVGVPSVPWRLFNTLGDTISTVEGIQYIAGITSVHVGDNICTVGDNINTVEGTQYSGGEILISTCLVINNDENISTFFVLRYEIFIQKFLENSSRFHAF